jgi:hypothetical protein
MPYCSECGKQLEENVKGICANCQKIQDEKLKATKKYHKPHFYSLSRGLKYPVSISYIVVLIILVYLPQWMTINDYIKMLFPVIGVIYGVIAIGKEDSNIIASIGLVASVVFLLMELYVIVALISLFFGPLFSMI